MEEQRKFRVEEATRKDAGRGIARLHPQVMKELGITVGDVILIQGKGKTAAIVWPKTPLEDSVDTIRIDGITRRNADTAIDQYVTIKKVEAKEARTVTLAPTSPIKPVDGAPFLRQNLIGRAITRGDRLRFPFFGRMVEYVISSIQPVAEAVIVQNNTQLQIRERPTPQPKEQIPQVTYEDIGGLSDVIRKVRELVELPIRHPELFERLGISPPTGILLHGPPGTGKTMLAKAVANETNASFYPISGPEIMSKFYGECVGEDSLVLTNGSGLISIKDATPDNVHYVSGLNLKTGKITMNPVTEVFDKGIQDALRFVTPQGQVEVTPTSRFLAVRAGKTEWVFANELKVGDRIASPKTQAKSKSHKVLDEGIPSAVWLDKLCSRANLSQEDLTKTGINVKQDIIPRQRLQALYELLASRGAEASILQSLEQLLKLDVLWTPILQVASCRVHVYDLEVPEHHNFIANGLIVHNSEANLRKIFEEARENSPSIIFIDEVDAIAPKREEAKGEVERRVVAQLLALMDGLESRGQVVIIGATNRPNDIDPALRRPGRFDREIEIPVPDRDGRLDILHVHTRGMPLAADVDLKRLAAVTHGFVGADLAALAKEAAINTLRKILPKIDTEAEKVPQEILDTLEVSSDDFSNALREVEPSALREVIIERPITKWQDIGGLKEAKRLLREAVEWPLKFGSIYKEIHLKATKGILLYGPPGTGKTLLARAVAGESEANFISIKGPELISKWVGESEKGVRQIFKKAKQASPAVIFFDEFDALAANRTMGEADSGVGNRVLSQLLTELDGLEELRNVIVIAATNRPDLIDPALLRPGRLDYLVSVPLPDLEDRKAILHIHTRFTRLASDVNLNKLAEQTENFSGADLEAISREAIMLAFREFLKKYPDTIQAEQQAKSLDVNQSHFLAALKEHSQRPTIAQVIKRNQTPLVS